MIVTKRPLCKTSGNRALFQSSFWAAFKRKRGHKVEAYRWEKDGKSRDMVVIYRRFTGSRVYGYIPYGPETPGRDDEHGILLEELAEHLRPLLPGDCAFLRFDLPWNSPFLPENETAKKQITSRGHPAPNGFSQSTTSELPDTRIREMRMNFGSRNWNLLKAPTDMQPTDTVLLDLRQPCDSILANMKAKTRYNIRLAGRRGVTVRQTSLPDISRWYRLYRETARRKGIVCEEQSYFRNLFSLAGEFSPELLLLEAYYQHTLIAGIVVAIHRQRAYYLYGASSYQQRNMMAPHLLQWEAIRLAQKAGCVTYDMFGIPGRNSPTHPMYGLYRFKTGFGGNICHWRGCWDYPYDYTRYREGGLQTVVTNTYHVTS